MADIYLQARRLDGLDLEVSSGIKVEIGYRNRGLLYRFKHLQPQESSRAREFHVHGSFKRYSYWRWAPTPRILKREWRRENDEVFELWHTPGFHDYSERTWHIWQRSVRRRTAIQDSRAPHSSQG